jgi:rhodanese-related sulfurtransferase
MTITETGTTSSPETAVDAIAAPSGTRIDANELQRWLREGADVRLLDVRSPAEFESVHIPGAYNVPLDTLGEHAEDIQRHVEELVVLVCRSGMRASQAEQRLAAAGMGNVRVLEGGMMAWERAGGQVNAARPVGTSSARSDWWPARSSPAPSSPASSTPRPASSPARSVPV